MGVVIEIIELKPYDKDIRRFKLANSVGDVADFVMKEGKLKKWSNVKVKFLPFFEEYKILDNETNQRNFQGA